MDKRVIELERDLVETRRAAVAIVHDIVLSAGLDPAAIATTLDDRAAQAPPAEARLARLISETLRRIRP